MLQLQLRVRTADESTRAAVIRELVRDTRVEFVAPHRARLIVTWAFAGAAARVSSDNSIASVSSR